MSLLEILGWGKSKAAGETTAQSAEPATVEKLLEPLRASKHVGDIDAGSAFLYRLIEPLTTAGAGNFKVIQNIPSRGKYEGMLTGLKISELNSVYDGRAYYQDSSGDVAFELNFGPGASDKVREDVGAAVYPLFAQAQEGPTGENPAN